MNADIVRAIKPVVHQTPHGWLAVSEPGSPLRIGVAGSTESDARQGFTAELAEWAALRERPTLDEVGK